MRFATRQIRQGTVDSKTEARGQKTEVRSHCSLSSVFWPLASVLTWCCWITAWVDQRLDQGWALVGERGLNGVGALCFGLHSIGV